MNDSYDRVSRSPLNCSPTKQLYSFPKANRFNYTSRPYCQSFYDAKGISTSRTTTFGHSRRNETERSFSPPPDRYRLKTQFDRNVEQGKGCKFGYGHRESYLQQKNKDTPGPGAYNSRVDKFTNLAFSISGRAEDRKPKYTNPVGPGDYLLPSMNQTGEYFCSKYRNSGCARTSRSPRFHYEQSQTPGPGSYYPEQFTDINKQGVYLNSKYKSTHAVKFMKPYQSPARERSTSPGPGSQYTQMLFSHPFSEFGRRNKSTLRI